MKKYGKFLIGSAIALILASFVSFYFAITEYDFYQKVELYNNANEFQESTQALKRLAELDGDKTKVEEYEREIQEAARISFENWDYHIKAKYEREPNWILPAFVCALCFLTGFTFLMTGIFVFALGTHQNKLIKEIRSIGTTVKNNFCTLQPNNHAQPFVQEEEQASIVKSPPDSLPLREEIRTRRSRTGKITSAPPDSGSWFDTPDKQ